MWTRLCTFAFVAGFTTLIACGSADKGEDCEDDGVVGGDCTEGLLCTHSKPDDVSGLVCLRPCVDQSVCADNEICNGDRGRNGQACRPR
jgi:hypothetical protein